MTTESRSAKFIYRISALVALSVCACGPEPDDHRPLSERLGDISTDLTIGSAGSDVRALHQYLTRFGYLPNDTLAQQYPRWRAPVSTPPTDETVFDERTADAVRRLQLNSGQEPTGLVDEPLRDLIARPRCGVPDNMVAPDPSDKFAPLNNVGGTFAHNWWISGSVPINVSVPQMEAALRNASLTWMQQSSFTMAEANDFGATIAVGFGNLNDTTTVATTPDDGASITFNTQFTFGTGAGPNIWDIESVALHELGHALGLNHSSFNTPTPIQATMFSSLINGNRGLAPDDKVGISMQWDTYWQMPGLAIDIGAGGDGSVWVVGTDNHPYKWNGSSWVPDRTAKTFLRIAVDQAGIPWATNSSNQIFVRDSSDPSSGDWTMKPGAATDIGIGANGEAWIVGTDQRALKFDPSINPPVGDWRPVIATASAKRISVSPTGKPWIATTANTILSLSSNDPTTGAWQTLPGTGDDIGVGPGQGGPLRGQDGAVYKTDRGSFFVWDEQPAIGGGSGHTTPSSASWRTAGYNRTASFGDPAALPVGPLAVTVGPNGRAWAIGTNGAIFSTLR